MSISKEEAYLASKKDLKHLQRNTAVVTFFCTRKLKIASNKISLIFTFIVKSNTQVELRRNFEKLKMIHKQDLRSLQPSGKLSTEIKIEIAFIMIKFKITHYVRMFILQNSKREKFSAIREQNPFKHQFNFDEY